MCPNRSATIARYISIPAVENFDGVCRWVGLGLAYDDSMGWVYNLIGCAGLGKEKWTYVQLYTGVYGWFVAVAWLIPYSPRLSAQRKVKNYPCRRFVEKRVISHHCIILSLHLVTVRCGDSLLPNILCTGTSFTPNSWNRDTQPGLKLSYIVVYR